MKRINQKGFTVVEGLLIVVAILLLGFGGYYVWNENQSTNPEGTDSTSTTEQESLPVSESNESGNIKTLSSKLYPEVVFDAYEGWELSELSNYDSGVSSTISLLKNNAKVDFYFGSSADRGGIWPECFITDTYKFLGYETPDGYEGKGQFSRYENEGKFSYGFVDSNPDSSYQDFANLGGYSIDDITFCANNGIIATVNSITPISQASFSHDKDSDGYADAWLEGITTNTQNIEKSTLNEMDTIVAKFVVSSYQ